ncbi:MAG: indole-3-glycerol phosphate synthase TrpC [Elusimicrobia bacterium]|nr:indole-3-glycerol phosphate synthase TrpC [Elusimicrobiota bacterium]
MRVLDRIAQAARMRVAQEKARVPAEALESSPLWRRARLDFAAAFGGQGPRIIAEVKLRSPSAPDLGQGLDPVDVARSYDRNGAAAISVLTEPEFFGGSPDILRAVREQVSLPLLMKDFVVDPYQIGQARACGADAVLLIVALWPQGLEDMLARTARLGLAALVEVHDEPELELALAAGARIIGVNNRDLKTLGVDLQVSRRLAASAQGQGALLIAESGISRRAEIAELSGLGFQGFLMGTALMAGGQPGAALAALLGRTPR